MQDLDTLGWISLVIPILHRCTELEGREWKKNFRYRSMINDQIINDKTAFIINR